MKIRFSPRTSLALMTCALLAAGAGVVRTEGSEPPEVPDSPATPFALVPPPAPASRPSPAIPPDLAEEASALTLADVIDIALRNSPDTRETWASARSRAAAVGIERSDYWPDVTFDAGAAKGKQSFAGGRLTSDLTTYGPTVEIGYLLLDFGGRRGRGDEAVEALRAAGWTHNSTIQTVVLAVQEAYYGYASAKAQLEAAQVGEREAATNLEAAEARRRSGVATIAEVLQARTAASQARLLRLSFEGQVKTLLGALATSMGLSADTPLDVEVLPASPPVDAAGEEVARAIETALASRPDLAAARTDVLAEEGRIRAKRSDRLPILELSGSANRTYYHPGAFGSSSDNWSLSLLFSFPVFDGFERKYEVIRAEADRDAAQAAAERMEQQVVYDVWRSYYELRTAADRVRTSGDLLASAEESEVVALARYREGVGSILDLLTAQSSLALARAQEIAARSDWFVSAARLAYATGRLGPGPAAPEPGGSHAPD